MTIRFASNIEKLPLIDIQDLVLDECNAKIHTEKQINQLARIIETEGFNEPITLGCVNDKDPIVICGNGRVKAMRLLNVKQIPYVKINFRSDAQRKAYGLKNNAIQLETGFNKEMVSRLYDDIKLEPLELINIQEIDLTVLEPIKIDAMNECLDNPEAFYERIHSEKGKDNDSNKLNVKLTEDDELTNKTDRSNDMAQFIKEGDVILLGRHTLMCGDACNKDNLNTLLKGIKACEESNRSCYMMELDPHYCEVILNRYMKYTETTTSDVFLVRNNEKVSFKEIVDSINGKATPDL